MNESKGLVTTKLGDGQVFVRQDEKGMVRCVKGEIALSQALGEVAIIQEKATITVALMVALILTRNPACKILGVELGECDTNSAEVLLSGLDKISGQLDNIIVCS